MVCTLLLVSYLFANIAAIKQIHPAYIFWYGAFVFLTVFAMTELMDRKRLAAFWEGLRGTLGMGLLVYQGDWFGAGKTFGPAPYLVGAYLLISFGMASWFTIRHAREDKQSSPGLAGSATPVH